MGIKQTLLNLIPGLAKPPAPSLNDVVCLGCAAAVKRMRDNKRFFATTCGICGCYIFRKHTRGQSSNIPNDVA
jgi:hypothetical protein